MLVVALAGACAGDASEQPTTDTTVSVGDERVFDQLGSTTTGAAAAASSPSTTAPVVVPRSSAGATASTAPARGHRTVVDTDGFRLNLAVGDDGRTEFGPSDVVPLTLRVENVSGTTRQYDTNDLRNFAIVRAGTNEPVWDNVRCKKGQSARDTIITGVNELSPGESVSYADAYPSDAAKNDPTPRGDCRIPAGSYDVVGIFNWCPPGSAPNGTCYPDRLAHAVSLPVRITIKP